MARHFAEIVNNKVVRVILADDIKWCQDNLGGQWMETYNPNEPPTPQELAKTPEILEHKNYAGVGHDVMVIKGKVEFVQPKPAECPSFILDEDTARYIPPGPEPVKPADPMQVNLWDEKNQQWIVKTFDAAPVRSDAGGSIGE